MADNQGFSAELLQKREAKNPLALARITIAKRRIQSVLDQHIVAHQRTLEQKISEQGPNDQRVDPNLLGLAIFDLLKLNRLQQVTHRATGKIRWYANRLTSTAAITARLAEQAPLYAATTAGGFGSLIGDALEVAVYKCLDDEYQKNARYPYLGHFRLNEPKDKHGRYRKTQPPKSVAGHVTAKEADFIQFGHDAGPLCIECKNYREWAYPHQEYIKELIIKASQLKSIPVLIARRLHYTTRTNLLQPAGIIAHETYFQYYPSDQTDLAQKISHRKLLGFTDVRATEEPDARTRKFFSTTLPKLVTPMSVAWLKNKDVLIEYANDEINLAQLYNAINSPGQGNWIEPEDEDLDIAK